MHAKKLATSLPAEQFAALERTRKRLRLRRSEAFQQALSLWLSSKEQDLALASYVRGYLEHPDDPGEARALVAAWARGLQKEDW
jgi:hypothetical protein